MAIAECDPVLFGYSSIEQAMSPMAQNCPLKCRISSGIVSLAISHFETRERMAKGCLMPLRNSAPLREKLFMCQR